MWFPPEPTYATHSVAFKDFCWLNKGAFRGYRGLGLAAVYACMCMIPRWVGQLLAAFLGTALAVLLGVVRETVVWLVHTDQAKKKSVSWSWLQLLAVVLTLVQLST